jgi:hypothetical protein
MSASIPVSDHSGRPRAWRLVAVSERIKQFVVKVSFRPVYAYGCHSTSGYRNNDGLSSNHLSTVQALRSSRYLTIVHNTVVRTSFFTSIKSLQRQALLQYFCPSHLLGIKHTYHCDPLMHV